MGREVCRKSKWKFKMAFAIKGGGGGVGRLMANAILNFHFDYLHTSLSCFAEPGNDINATLRRLSRNPPHLPISKVRRKGEVYISSCTGINPTAMLKTLPIPYFSASRKPPHMG